MLLNSFLNAQNGAFFLFFICIFVFENKKVLYTSLLIASIIGAAGYITANNINKSSLSKNNAVNDLDLTQYFNFVTDGNGWAISLKINTQIPGDSLVAPSTYIYQSSNKPIIRVTDINNQENITSLTLGANVANFNGAMSNNKKLRTLTILNPNFVINTTYPATYADFNEVI